MNVVIQNKDDLAKTLKELIFNDNVTTNENEKDKSNNSAL